MRAARWLLPAIPALLAAGLHAPSLGFEFVWDDWALIPIPPYTTLEWLAVWTGPGNGVHYLPVRDTTLLLDTWLFGSWAGGFHATNVALFAAAVALAAVAWRALFRRSGDPRVARGADALALACALVFAAHPLQVESVAFVSSRNGLLALLFGLAGALAYGRYVETRRPGAWAASLAFVAAALLSKQTAVTLPAVLLLLHLHLAKRDGLVTALRPLLPHAALAIAAAVLHARIAAASDIVVGGTDPLSLLARAPVALLVPVFYAAKLLWPVGLTVEYDLQPWREHALLVGLAGGLLLAGAAEVVRRGHATRSLPWLLVLATLVALAPVLNLLPTVPAVADRYTQLPMVAAVPLLLVPLLVRLPPRAGAAAVLVAVAALSALTLRQLPVWRDDAALFAHAAAHHPRPAQTIGNLGLALFERGEEERALEVMERLHAIDPRDFRYAYVRGMRAEQQGRTDEAARWYREATAGEGEHLYVAWMKLGDLHLRRGERDAARQAYTRALALAREARFADAARQALEMQLRVLGPAREAPAS